MHKLHKHRASLLELSKNPQLISEATLPQLTCVVEILHNLSQIPFTYKEKRKICKHVPIIKEIAKCSRERKARHTLNQHGIGFLGAVIPAALALLSLVGDKS